jgi:two-component system sensor histidine kinase CpxA
MRSLLLRIFLSFWLIIVLTIFMAASMGFLYAERVRSSLQSFEVSEAMAEAGEMLRERGRGGLVDWLESLPSVTGSLVYIIDEEGRELLDRRLPAPVELALRRFGRPAGVKPARPRDPGNLRPPRPFAQLVGPTGEVYTLIVLPPQGAVARWLTERGRLSLAIIALLVSGGVSYLLAGAISRPIRRFRESTVAIADGDLESRVASSVEERRDEIGGLAQDFNQMARKLQLAWQRQRELTSNVSHELRSPIARLKVALELARRKTGELPELDRIDVETDRLDELIGQLLTFSKLDTNTYEAARSVDLAELTSGVVEDVSYEYTNRDVNIQLQSDNGVSVNAYPNALRSAVENVLRNAVSHGGGDVQVRFHADSAVAVIAVADSGGGVPEADLQHLFEPFYRATKSMESPGTGLGLAIAERVMAMHDGSIEARNTNTGLVIEMRLRLRPA